MNTIDLSDDEEAVEGFSYSPGPVLFGAHEYIRVSHPPMVVDQRRWATIYRQVWRRDDGTFWGFDHEETHSETAEPWSYIEPRLIQVGLTTIEWWVEV